MSDTWNKTKIWTKLIVLGLVLLFVLIFVLKNYSQKADVWFWTTHEMSVLELLVGTFLAGVIATLLARPTYHTIRQIGELRKKPDPAPPIPLAPAPETTPEPAKPTP
jgi:uncharacterized integral membrane protein